MNKEDEAGTIGLVTGFAIGLVATSVVCSLCTSFNSDWHQQAVNHHAAHYDSKTGNFTWNDEAKNGTAQPRTSEAARQAESEGEPGK